MSRGVSVIKIGGHGLKDFRARIRGSFHLTGGLPRRVLQVSRDNVSDPRAIGRLQTTNFQNFLVKRGFVGAPTPKRTLGRFVARLRGY